MQAQLKATFDLEYILEAGNVHKIVEAIKEAGFEIYSDAADYTDLEFEAKYSAGSSDLDRKSVNYQFSFDWDTKVVYQSLGINLGEGFDCSLSVNDDGRPFEQQLEEEIHRNLGTATNEFQAAWEFKHVRNEIYAAAKRLSKLFRR